MEGEECCSHWILIVITYTVLAVHTSRLVLMLWEILPNNPVWPPDNVSNNTQGTAWQTSSQFINHNHSMHRLTEMLASVSITA